MNSGKSERKSRRSSILKVPKPRQPVQNDELSPSSTENSPVTSTTKLKRRVSFAEKKHVKEFCDSIEQGTVWDNTYEESELSQMRNSQNSNSDENIVDFVERTNSPLIHQNAFDSKSIDEISASAINLTGNKNQNSAKSKSLSFIAVQSEDKENINVIEHHDESAMESDLDLTDTVGTVAQAEETSTIIQHDKITIFHDSFNEAQSDVLTNFSKIHESMQTELNVESSMGMKKNTIFEAGPADLVEDLSEGVSEANLNEHRNKPKIITEKTRFFPNKFIDLTNVMKNTMSIDEAQKIIEKTMIFHNTSVDKTNVAQNIGNIGKSRDPPMDTSNVYHNNTVDLTEVVENIPRVEELQKMSPEKTTIFHNKSVDFTEVVQHVPRIEESQKISPEKTTIFHNKSVDFTEVVQNVPRIEESQKISPEKTTIFHNKSIDFTEVVQNVPRIEESQKISPEKTTIFHNKSVDFTEVVQNVPRIEESQKISPEKTTIFHNKSVDFTEVVQNVPHIEKSRKRSLEKTTIFHNKSVDFTEVVQNVARIEESQKLSPEKTTIFHNKSVDFTEVVQNVPRIEESQKISPEKTTIFQNKSVDFTEVVHNIVNIEQAQKLQSEKTSIFHDQFLNFTGIVPNVPSTEKRIYEKTEDYESKGRKLLKQMLKLTEVDADAMEEAIPPPSLPSVLISENPTDLNRVEDVDGHPEVMDFTVLHDESMEITTAIPSLLQSTTNRAEEASRIIVFNDKSIRPTNSSSLSESSKVPPFSREVPACDAEINYQSMAEGKNTIFHDASMELTSAISSQTVNESHFNEQEHETYEPKNSVELEKEGKTVVFDDDSMMITRALNSSLQSKQFRILDKENCPIGMEHLLIRDTKCSRNQRQIKLPQSKFVDDETCAKMIKPVQFPSLPENEENLMDLGDLEEQHRPCNIESEDISGIVPLSSQIANSNSHSRDLQFTEEAEQVMELRSEEMDFTVAVPQSSVLNEDRIEFSRQPSHMDPMEEMDPPPEELDPLPEEMEIFHTNKKLYQCLSLQDKESGHQSVTSPMYIERKDDKNDIDRLKCTNMIDEIRQLAENFSRSNSNGFDQSTFLRQQASCLKDHEAHTTASQEFNSRSLSTNRDTTRGDSHESGKSHCERSSVDIERPELLTNDIFPSLSTNAANKSTMNDRNVDSSLIDRGSYDKSLEDLRSRAYSVKKFRSEQTICELTEALMPLSDLQAEEPPSFVFAQSLISNSIDNADRPNRSRIEAQLSIDRENIECQEFMKERGVFHVSQLTEKFSSTLPCVPPDLPEIEETQQVFLTESPNVLNDVKMEDRMERKERRRSKTSVIRNGIPDVEHSSLSSLIQCDNETDDNVKNHRNSNTGITTAGGFSSESNDGPSEKLFRRDTVLPTEDHNENTTISTETAVGWDVGHFANSTVNGDDFGHQLMFQGTNKKRLLAEHFPSDELTSEFISNEGTIVDQLTSMEVTEGTNDLSTNLESLKKRSFCIFKETVERLSKRSDTIWNIKRLDEKIVRFNFFSKSIVLAVYLNESPDFITIHPVKKVALISQLVKETNDPGVCLAHSLIMTKLNTGNAMESCQTYEEIPQLLEHVSKEVKLGMDFLFDLDRLRNHNVMEINDNRITFMTRTRDINAGIILNITIVVKPFKEINHNDITVECVLGSEKIRINDIKKLITNVKKDHRFLRFYMTDVLDYIDLMAETGFSKRS